MTEMSVCWGVGGRGLEPLPGGLLHMDSLSNEGTTWASSTGLGVDGSTAEDREMWEGRHFFGSNLCEPGLFLSPVKGERSINNAPDGEDRIGRDNLIIH